MENDDEIPGMFGLHPVELALLPICCAGVLAVLVAVAVFFWIKADRRDRR